MFDGGARPKMHPMRRARSSLDVSLSDLFETVVQIDDGRGSCSISVLANNLSCSLGTLIGVLRNHPTLFTVTDDGYVRYSPPEICENHCTQKGCMDDDCTALHICKYFAVGRCTNRKCEFGHDFFTYHNDSILCNLKIDDLSEDILQLALGNRRQVGVTVPSVCSYYNRASGCTNKKCTFLHLCDHYLNKKCKFGQKCKRSHNLYDDQPKRILFKYNIDTDRSPKETLQELQQYMDIPERAGHRSVSESSDDAPFRPATATTSDDDTPEICSYFLSGKCSFGQKCRNIHDKKTYRWQFKTAEVSTWTSFNDDMNEKLEKYYRDPNANSVTVRMAAAHVNFNQISSTSEPVRRLSTISSIRAPASKAAVSTTWRWYWKDVDGKFVMYGDRGAEDVSQISSDDIEDKYLNDPTGEVVFATSRHNYVLSFAGMKQRNVGYKTEREVRRRPVETCQDQRSTKTTSLPSHWEPMSKDKDFKRVPIFRTGTTKDEYQKAEALFLQTMRGRDVTKIERVQNQDLWEKYTLKKTQMQKKSSTTLNEKLLFHGTTEAVIDGICEQGFDWRLTGTRVGAIYGRGSYFHSEASYSRQYTDCRKLFLARALIGKYTNGTRDMLRPPPISASDPNKLYDSVVNNATDPKIFVVFTHEQVYPEYIITYSPKKL